MDEFKPLAGGRVVGVKPQNLVDVVGLLDLVALPDVFRQEVLQRLDPTDLAILRRVNRGLRAAVESSSDLPRARRCRSWLISLSGPSSGYLGRRTTGARGPRARVQALLRKETWRCCNGRGRTGVQGLLDVYVRR